MLKEVVKMNIEDRYIIYGTINKPKKDTDKLIIFVHGLLSSQNHPAFIKATNYLKKENYAVLRFDFYSRKEKSRLFSNTTLQEQANDLEKIINNYAKKFKQIHLIAHSLGGIISLLAKTDGVKNIILWEPSIEAKDVFSDLKEKDENHYIFCKNIVEKKVIDNINSIPSLKKLIKKKNEPIKIFVAKNFGDKHGLNLYFKNISENNKKFYIIKGADHNFNKKTNKLIKKRLI